MKRAAALGMMAMVAGAATACAPDAPADDAGQVEGASTVPVDYEKRAQISCDWKANRLLEQNGKINGSFFTCIGDGARGACDWDPVAKKATFQKNAYWECSCSEDFGAESKLLTTASCTANNVATDADCEKLEVTLRADAMEQYYCPDGCPEYKWDLPPKTYLNVLEIELKNGSNKDLTVRRVYKHDFQCSGPLPDQNAPLALKKGEHKVEPFTIQYQEAKFGPEFQMNTSTVELRCGNVVKRASVRWKRTRDASDPGRVLCGGV